MAAGLLPLPTGLTIVVAVPGAIDLLDDGAPQAPAPSPKSTQVRGLAGEARDIAALSPRLQAYNAAYIALALAVAFGAIALFWVHQAWWTFAIAFVVVASRQQALLNCEHEAVHRKLFANRRANDLVGTFVCAAPVASPFGAAQARHLSHHRLLATPDDPDANLHTDAGKETRGKLLRYFVNGLIGGYAGMVLMGPRAPQAAARAGSPQRDLLSLALAQAIIGAGLTLTTAWWVYPALWLLPLATLTALCHLVRSFVEHAITRAEAPEHGNRLITIRSNWLERAIVSPYFMNYHAEHHLLPSVPAPRLRELQERLRARDDVPTVLERPSYSGAIRHYAGELPDR